MFSERIRRDKNAAKTNWSVYVLAIVALFLVGMVTGYIQINNGQICFKGGSCYLGSNSGGGSTTASNNPIPISFSAIDAGAPSSGSNALSSLSTEEIFLPGSSTVYDTSSSTSNPIVFTQSYTNGENVILAIGKSTYVTAYRQFNIQGLPSSLSGGLTSYTVGNVYTVKTGTFKLVCNWVNGTVFTTSQTYNATISGNAAAQTVTCQLRNTVVNTGYDTTWNPVTGAVNGLVCAWNDTNTAQAVAFNSYNRITSKGAATYYPYQIPDGISGPDVQIGTSPDGLQTTAIVHSLSGSDAIGGGSVGGVSGGSMYFQPVSATAAVGGVATFTIGMTDNVAHGSTEVAGLSCWSQADSTVFGQPSPYAGTFGPNAATLGIGITITWEK